MKYMVDYRMEDNNEDEVESIIIKANSVKECELYMNIKYGKQCKIIRAMEIKRTTWR